MYTDPKKAPDKDAPEHFDLEVEQANVSEEEEPDWEDDDDEFSDADDFEDEDEEEDNI